MSSTEGPPDPRAPDRPARASERGFGEALGLTFVGAVVPGTGYLAAGKRWLGWACLIGLGSLLTGVVGILLVEHRPKVLLAELASRPQLLLLAGFGVAVLAAVWVIVILTEHRLVMPRSAPAWQRGVGVLVALVLCLGVAIPSAFASRYSFATYDLVTSVFHDGHVISQPGITSAPIDRKDPWQGEPRVNILMLGGDAGADREGLRTDSVIVASIDTRTGATVLFSLPRNLENVPFTPDSPMHALWPNGFNCGYSGGCILNAIYEQGLAHASDFPSSVEDPGVAAVESAVSATLGLNLDFFIMVDLDGFEALVNALGGITIDVGPERVPIGGLDINGNPLPASKIGQWIPAGVQHLNGFQALWFARDRWSGEASDYMRMRRQRCVLNAIAQQASPTNMLANYLAVADAAKDNIESDIPYQLFPAFVELAGLVQQHPILSLPFTNDVITSANPDFALIRTLVQRGIVQSEQAAAAAPTTSPTAGPTTGPSGTPTAGATSTPSVTPTPDATDAVVANDVCG